jgi:hypothetical protein
MGMSVSPWAEAIVKGDAKSVPISAASVIAKVRGGIHIWFYHKYLLSPRPVYGHAGRVIHPRFPFTGAGLTCQTCIRLFRCMSRFWVMSSPPSNCTFHVPPLYSH